MRIRNTLHGLALMATNTKVFYPNRHFKNKRVAVIGAADSAFEEENGEYLNNFDFIVRVNKAPHSLTPDKHKFIGSRTDVLFHSFFESFKDGGGGPIDWELYREQGIRFVINPHSNPKGLRDHLNFYKRNLNSKTTFLLPPSLYKDLKNSFGDLVPTVGFSSLYAVLSAQCQEVYITGFTFFKTPYADDYRDDLKDVKKNDSFMKKQGFHNPDLELREFIKKLQQVKKMTKVKMDPALNDIMAHYSKELNGQR